MCPKISLRSDHCRGIDAVLSQGKIWRDLQHRRPLGVQEHPSGAHAVHDRRYAIDTAKIERECAFRPSITLEAGLRATVAWYLERADILRTVWRRTIGE